MPSKVWREITFPFPNFNSATIEVGEGISNFTQTLKWMQLLIRAGIEFRHVS